MSKINNGCDCVVSEVHSLRFCPVILSRVYVYMHATSRDHISISFSIKVEIHRDTYEQVPHISIDIFGTYPVSAKNAS